jgi:hypothetical protein
LKTYSDPSHYFKNHRYHLNDIIKALWNDRSPDERDQVYGTWVRQFEYTPDIAEADLALMTMKWNYYVDKGLISLAHEELQAARDHGKKIAVFSGGDSPANLTDPNVILFEMGGYRSSSGLAYHSGQPFILNDYLPTYCGGEVQVRQKTDVPTLGFCGQASASPLRTLFRKARNQARKLQYQAGRTKWQPPPFETTSFRWKVLRQFEGQAQVRINYLLREQYHAGSSQEKTNFSDQKLAFVNNILGSDYTVCMRGGGNFSIRFYETLCLGRIPVFIDSDCQLPFEDKIAYRELFPWIELKDLPRAVQIVADFHASLSNEDFIALQYKCRQLWEEHFTANGFYRDFQARIIELI